MNMTVPSSAAFVPVCSQAGGRLAAFPALRAKRAEKAEGKIKETGTTSGRFLKLLLSAHCLGAPRAAPHFLTPRAAILRNALALLGSGQHHSLKSAGFAPVWLEAHP